MSTSSGKLLLKMFQKINYNMPYNEIAMAGYSGQRRLPKFGEEFTSLTSSL